MNQTNAQPTEAMQLLAYAIVGELVQAMAKFPKFNSPHEGWAVLREEVDELWDEVKTKGATQYRMAMEAIQVAAMAMRFVHDCCPVVVASLTAGEGGDQ